MEITNHMYVEYFEAFINGKLDELHYDRDTQRQIVKSGLEKGIFEGDANEMTEGADFSVNKLRIGKNGHEIFSK
ncbi:hypothetical protein ACMGE6_11560 [Macrococcus equi]|uniref:hypothetical protein n=1 Tax=Macrococcus equi TaxID=3395462 RepID=UPI0039BE10DF